MVRNISVTSYNAVLVVLYAYTNARLRSHFTNTNTVRQLNERLKVQNGIYYIILHQRLNLKLETSNFKHMRSL